MFQGDVLLPIIHCSFIAMLSLLHFEKLTIQDDKCHSLNCSVYGAMKKWTKKHQNRKGNRCFIFRTNAFAPMFDRSKTHGPVQIREYPCRIIIIFCTFKVRGFGSLYFARYERGSMKASTKKKPNSRNPRIFVSQNKYSRWRNEQYSSIILCYFSRLTRKFLKDLSLSRFIFFQNPQFLLRSPDIKRFLKVLCHP